MGYHRKLQNKDCGNIFDVNIVKIRKEKQKIRLYSEPTVINKTETIARNKLVKAYLLQYLNNREVYTKVKQSINYYIYIIKYS